MEDIFEFLRYCRKNIKRLNKAQKTRLDNIFNGKEVNKSNITKYIEKYENPKVQNRTKFNIPYESERTYD